MNIIGYKIRHIREKKGLSQENLAQELGITQPSYARLEKEDQRIKITRLIQIARILKTTVAELIDESIEINNKKTMSEIQSYSNIDEKETIINADKDHILTLKEENAFLKRLVEKINIEFKTN
ncbi:helix-turn-helix transcriptional regulator [uncultured Flavobacterium sp.]|uniref:helix-turn-helix domain-containing protein n=1 Tax=uncultured Flavobacterium sp. TaxID=165435 RepID=UPI0030CA2A98